MIFKKHKNLVALLLILHACVLAQNGTGSLISTLSNKSSYKDSINVYNSIARKLYQVDSKEGIRLTQLSLNMAIKHKDSLAIYESYIILGNCFLTLSAYDKAIDYNFKAMKIVDKLKDEKQKAYLLDDIGFVYWRLNRFDDALFYFYQSMQTFKKIKDIQGQILNLNHIGLVRWKQEEFDLALDCFNNALQLIDSTGISDKLPAILNNIGIIYDHIGEHEKSIPYFLESLEANKRADQLMSIAENMNNLGEVYTSLKKYKVAWQYLNTADSISRKIDAKILMYDNSYLFSRLYYNLGKYLKAFEYSERAMALKDTLANSKLNSRLENLEYMRAMEKKENEIKLLETEQKLQEAKINEQNTLLWLQTALIIILFVVAAIQIQTKKKRAAYKELVKKNIELVESERMSSDILKYIKPDIQSTKSGQEKYSGSTLEEDQKKKIMRKLISVIETDKIYLENTLTINDLSKKLLTSRTYLSQVINEKYGKSFSNYINEYRIKEARRLLTKQEYRIYTIDSISKSVGFNSTNAFNKAFKKFTGVTPSNYIKYSRIYNKEKTAAKA